MSSPRSLEKTAVEGRKLAGVNEIKEGRERRQTRGVEEQRGEGDRIGLGGKIYHRRKREGKRFREGEIGQSSKRKEAALMTGVH